MNKIIASIVLTLVLFLGINKITDAIYYVEKPVKSAYQIDGISTIASTGSDEMSSEDSNSTDIIINSFQLLSNSQTTDSCYLNPLILKEFSEEVEIKY